jgi:hypothetical protein
MGLNNSGYVDVAQFELQHFPASQAAAVQQREGNAKNACNGLRVVQPKIDVAWRMGAT